MEKKSNNTWVIAVIVLVLVAAVIFALTRKPETTPVVVEDGTSVQDDTEIESTLDTTGVTTGVAPVSLSYANALVQYKDRRIQLDPTCQAHPNTITYKDNTGVMIDNRSSKTRTVKIGTTFTIKPYGFKIFVLPNITTAPRTILVDCDSSQNVATILVQE